MLDRKNTGQVIRKNMLNIRKEKVKKMISITKRWILFSLAGALCLCASGCKEEDKSSIFDTFPQSSQSEPRTERVEDTSAAPVQRDAATREAQAAAEAAQEGKVHLFGVTLGKPFPEDMPQCPEDYFLQMKHPMEEPCVYLPDRPNGAPETPYVGVVAFPRYGVYETLFGVDRVSIGADVDKAPNVLYIPITHGSQTQDELMRLLREQMGEPTSFAVKSAEQTKPPEGMPFDLWYSAREGSFMAFWKGEEVWAMYGSSRSSGDQGQLQVGLYSALENSELPQDEWPF